MLTAAQLPLIRRFRLPGYLILGGALLLPVLDLITSLTPMLPSGVAWRYGAAALLATSVSALLLVLLFLYAIALFAGDRHIVLACSVFAALLGVLLLVSTPLFALDALQLRRRYDGDAAARMVVASLQVVFRLVFQGVSALIFAVSAYRTLKYAHLYAVMTPRAGAPDMLIGRPSSSKPGG